MANPELLRRYLARENREHVHSQTSPGSKSPFFAGRPAPHWVFGIRKSTIIYTIYDNAIIQKNIFTLSHSLPVLVPNNQNHIITVPAKALKIVCPTRKFIFQPGAMLVSGRVEKQQQLTPYGRDVAEGFRCHCGMMFQNPGDLGWFAWLGRIPFVIGSMGIGDWGLVY